MGFRTALLIATSLSTFSKALFLRQPAPQHGQCRFSPTYSQDQIMHDSTDLENDIFYWEGGFHADGVGYRESSGMSIGYTALGYQTGLPTTRSLSHTRSDPVSEAFHIMLLALAINGSVPASTFVYRANPIEAPDIAAAILTTKLQTYLNFNGSYPGYGGFLPTFESNLTAIQPAYDTHFQVSAADNGQLLWAVYALISVLERSTKPAFQQLGGNWTEWFIYTRNNAKTIFLQGEHPGEVCAVSILKEQPPTSVAAQHYACEDPRCLNNDPFEGELMSWMLYFSPGSAAGGGDEISNIADAIWDVKRGQLLAVNYTGNIVDESNHQYGTISYNGDPIIGRHLTPITTERGLYFGSNEHVKLFFLPYRDVPVIDRVFKNAERIRTCDSMLMGVPGMFASTSNGTSPSTGIMSANATLEYQMIDNAGIPSAAVFEQQELDVVTPYAVAPTILYDRHVGLAWYKNMLDGKQMQTVYGSTAAARLDGSAVSRFVSWKTKAPTLLALTGGVVDIVRDAMHDDGIYEAFYQRIEDEYSKVFDDGSGESGTTPILGELVPMCLPNTPMPTSSLIDFSSCNSGTH